MPRIVRKETPPRLSGDRGYRKARPYVRRDFDYRCAYCMIHEQVLTDEMAFVIDHFQPVKELGALNDYRNLFWSCMGCNTYKQN